MTLEVNWPTFAVLSAVGVAAFFSGWALCEYLAARRAKRLKEDRLKSQIAQKKERFREDMKILEERRQRRSPAVVALFDHAAKDRD